MSRDNTLYQKRQWIQESYKSIVEDPESYGYANIADHMDDVVSDIKEDVESAFECSIEIDFIKAVIENGNNC